MIRLVSSIVASVLVVAAAASADIAPDPLATGGASLVPKAGRVAGEGWGDQKGHDVTDAVSLLWEEVDLYPSPEKNAVAAVFCLKNVAEKEVAMEVGFPDYSKTRLEDFAAEVDGHKVAVQIKNDAPEGPKRIFKSWLCWSMTFPPGQEVVVKVSYWMKTGRVFPQLYHDHLPEDLKAKLWPYESGYVIRTGAGWAGPIGKAVVRIHYSDAVAKPLTTLVAPKSGWRYDAKANADVLTLEKFEPNASSDVQYTFRLCDTRQEVALLTEALKAKRLHPWSQQRLLDLVEKDASLGLSADERARQAIEVLRWMVPPLGPAVDQSKISRGAEAVVHKAYQRLLKHYRDCGRGDEALALATHFEKFLANMLQRDVQFKTGGGMAGAEYRRVEKEHDDVLAYLSQAAGK